MLTYNDTVETLECLEPLDALENQEAIFIRCWDCYEIINSGVFPVCDNCVIAKGPARRWCCENEDRTVPIGTMPFQHSLCHYNLAYWGRWESVFHRRALTA